MTTVVAVVDAAAKLAAVSPGARHRRAPWRSSALGDGTVAEHLADLEPPAGNA